MPIESQVRDLYEFTYRKEVKTLDAKDGGRLHEYHQEIAHRKASLTVLGITHEQIPDGDRRFDCDDYPFDIEGPAHQLRRAVLTSRKLGNPGSIQSAADRILGHAGMPWRLALQKVHRENPVPVLPLP